jgi:two-component system OmpR family response regulator
MKDRPHIVVVEDDPEIRSLLQGYLAREGFRVTEVDGGAALDRFVSYYGEPDLIILDLMLPGEDGLSICRRLRAASRIPVIMLTARGEDVDKIVGLEMGADDYVPKPFNPRELVARIRAVLRRLEPMPEPGRKQLSMGSFLVDVEGRSVTDKDGMEIDLTGAEFDLLACFVARPKRVLSRDQLMDWTRGRQADALDRTIDVQISRLRKKLDCGGEPVIKTIRNAGYMLVLPVCETTQG